MLPASRDWPSDFVDGDMAREKRKREVFMIRVIITCYTFQVIISTTLSEPWSRFRWAMRRSWLG